MRRIPSAAPGLRIGLLGGSFDPPHRGHLHISEIALKRLGLHRVWWLVSPGNPLKPKGPADLDRRMAACEALARRPSIIVTDIERRIRTRYTADTLRKLTALYPGVRFVWLMGADNMVTFHHWDDWTWIANSMPIAVLARPGQQLHAGLSVAAQRFKRARIPQRRAGLLTTAKPPCWSLLTHPMSGLSSTEIRASGNWP